MKEHNETAEISDCLQAYGACTAAHLYHKCWEQVQGCTRERFDSALLRLIQLGIVLPEVWPATGIDPEETYYEFDYDRNEAITKATK